ncbi:MAG: 6-phosphogluconolactonase [Bryobacteraceae bacterium]|nr:6-phosphogluconolactonase [Bryobacteraceae bacterium]
MTRLAISNDPAAACGRAILDKLAPLAHPTLAVSGGSSPRKMFEWMAVQDFDWSKLHFYWVDERCVPPDHADSNYRMTREALLDRVRMAAVHRILGELDPAEAAARYTMELPERFDMVHLGMGADAHTASLFPGLAEIADREGRAAAVWVPKLNAHRITLLPRMILGADEIIVLAAGADKAKTLLEVFTEPQDPMSRPIQMVLNRATWFLDPPAASQLPIAVTTTGSGTA